MDHGHIHDGEDRRAGLDRRQKERRRNMNPVPVDRRTGSHRRLDAERRNLVAEILVTPIMIRRP
jgi:hypothetical protein